MELPIYIKREHVGTKNVRDNVAHYHNNIELIYVLKGNMDCQTNNSIFSLEEGDLCFINRNQIHHLYEKTRISEHISVIIDTSLLTKYSDITNKYIEPMINDVSFSHVKFKSLDSNSEHIYKLILDIEKLIKEKKETYELSVISDIHLIFKYLYLTYINCDKEEIYDYDKFLCQKMIKYIEDNYQNDIKTLDLQNYIHISRTKCFKIFKKYTRLSPNIYINNYRIKKASEKLIETNDSIIDIALSSGFNDASYFNKLFLKEFNMRPKEFRYKYQK